MREITATRINSLGLDAKDFEAKQTADEKIEELKAQNQMLIECIMELADELYA